MPDAPTKPCAQPGCPNYASIRGRCAEHATKADAIRGNSAERGLGSDWRRLRARKLARDPICQIQTHCGKGVGMGDGAVATEVDHIIPRILRPDLRLVWTNLQSSCESCNAAKGDGAATAQVQTSANVDFLI